MQPHFPHDYEPGIPEVPPGFSPTDFEAGRWFLDALGGSPNGVGDIAPDGYEGYVHLPHPYWVEVPRRTDGSFYDPPDSEAEPGYWCKPIRRSVARSGDAPGNGPHLDPPIDSAMGAVPLIRPLIGVLRRRTPNDMTCLCGFWKVQLPTVGGGMTVYRAEPAAGSSRPHSLIGYVKSMVRDLQARNRARRVRRGIIAAATAHGSPGQVLLYRGSLDGIECWLSDFGALKASYHPSVFWPEDRRWCVAMPQNKPLSIVAGTRPLVEDILALTGMDAFEVKRSDDVWGI